MKAYIILLLFFTCHFATAQDQAVTVPVAKDLRIEFLKKPTISINLRAVQFSAVDNSDSYTAIADSNYVELDLATQNALDQYALQWSDARVVDTTIGSAKGKFVECRNVGYDGDTIARLTYFIARFGGLVYTLNTVQSTINQENNSRVKAFYDSAEFGASWGEAWINFLAPFVIIIPLAIFMISRWKKQRK